METLKAITINALMNLGPVARFAATTHVTGMDGNEEQARALFDFYQQRVSCQGKDVLELGVGKTLNTLSLALKAGAASAAAADVTRYHSEEDARAHGVRFVVYDGRTLPFADNSMDLVWACYCMQHFRHPDVSAREIARVLRPGGRLVCRVDLRDHYHMFEPGRQYDCWRHSTRVWRWMTSNRGSYVNRLRTQEWLDVLGRAGLQTLWLVRHKDAQILSQNRPHPYLQRYGDEEIETFRFDGVFGAP
jgi:SAM-dependent methyltransferase